ncbi:hypothetical protein GYH30_004826 [Glycine max]|uniref:Uncharacterized protein n=1 Tax=Glycine soja TaxID=3848 RepID=A0A0B2QCE6_GLYSO|nr:hypothetical protein GYH30_004826 [Glycine max]KHN19251.1 hypothetical protein glysoja_044244 [Glycine soja]
MIKVAEQPSRCRWIKRIRILPNYVHWSSHMQWATTLSAIGSSSTAWESYLLNFDHHDSKVPNVQDHHISSPSITIKQEFLKKDTPSDVADHKYLDPNLWSDLKDFQPFKPTIMPLKMESDDNNNADNVYSCTDSQRLDPDVINFKVPSVHFGTDFHFDESQLS